MCIDITTCLGSPSTPPRAVAYEMIPVSLASRNYIPIQINHRLLLKHQSTRLHTTWQTSCRHWYWKQYTDLQGVVQTIVQCTREVARHDYVPFTPDHVSDLLKCLSLSCTVLRQRPKRHHTGASEKCSSPIERIAEELGKAGKFLARYKKYYRSDYQYFRLKRPFRCTDSCSYVPNASTRRTRRRHSVI